MKKLSFLFILIFTYINSQSNENPKFLVESKNPFVLSTNDDYYYVLTENYFLKINKETGDIENNDYIENFVGTSEYYFYIADNSYNNYLFFPYEYLC